MAGENTGYDLFEGEDSEQPIALEGDPDVEMVEEGYVNIPYGTDGETLLVLPSDIHARLTELVEDGKNRVGAFTIQSQNGMFLVVEEMAEGVTELTLPFDRGEFIAVSTSWTASKHGRALHRLTELIFQAE